MGTGDLAENTETSFQNTDLLDQSAGEIFDVSGGLADLSGDLAVSSGNWAFFAGAFWTHLHFGSTKRRYQCRALPNSDVTRI